MEFQSYLWDGHRGSKKFSSSLIGLTLERNYVAKEKYLW